MVYSRVSATGWIQVFECKRVSCVLHLVFWCCFIVQLLDLNIFFHGVVGLIVTQSINLDFCCSMLVKRFLVRVCELSAALKKNSFDRDSPIWLLRSNAKDDYSGGVVLRGFASPAKNQGVWGPSPNRKNLKIFRFSRLTLFTAHPFRVVESQKAMC